MRAKLFRFVSHIAHRLVTAGYDPLICGVVMTTVMSVGVSACQSEDLSGSSVTSFRSNSDLIGDFRLNAKNDDDSRDLFYDESDEKKNQNQDLESFDDGNEEDEAGDFQTFDSEDDLAKKSSIGDGRAGGDEDPRRILSDYTDRFVVSAETQMGSQTPVHMLWVVDSSPSMQQFIRKVNKGFDSFLSGVKDVSTSVKVRMITGKTISDIVSSKNGIIVENQTVKSTEQLRVLAQYLSPNYRRYFGVPTHAEKTSQVTVSLKDDHFFTDEARKVFVVVTDQGENIQLPGGSAHYLKPSQAFLQTLTDKYGEGSLSEFRFFAFINTKIELEFNQSYRAVKKKLKGRIWDLSSASEEEWKTPLTEIHTDIISSLRLNHKFTLAHAPQEIVRVERDGEPLDEDKYKVVGGDKILIAVDDLQSGDDITVVYKSYTGS